MFIGRDNYTIRHHFHNVDNNTNINIIKCRINQKAKRSFSSNNLSSGTIAGIVVSCVAGIALILVVWFIIRRLRSRSTKQLLGSGKDEPFQFDRTRKTTELPGNMFSAEAPTNKVVNELPGETTR